MTSLRIVIVNWNAGAQLRNCLNSIVQTDKTGIELERVVVVDNASADHSMHGIESFPLPLDVISSAKNLGFAAACNKGAHGSVADYLLFLNPDTHLFFDSLVIPLKFMASPENHGVGICGIQLLDEVGAVSRSCARFPTLGRLAAGALGLNKLPGLRGAAMHMQDWDHAETRPVDHVIGAFFLIRRSLFESLGGFDDRFFVYLEDLDLSLRAHHAGWRTVYLAEARAFHAGGGTSRQVKAHRLFYSLRSRLLYGFKHFSCWQAWLLTLVTCIVEPFTRSAFCLLRGDWAGLHHTWGAYRMLWRGIGRIVRGEGRFEP